VEDPPKSEPALQADIAPGSVGAKTPPKGKVAPRSKPAEVDPEKAAEQEKKERIHALLDRAYALTEQLTPLERWTVMTNLLEVASREYPEKAVDWAIEMWTISKDLPDSMRSSAQSSVVSSIAHVDPDKALALLPLMDKPDGKAGFTSFASVAVFNEMQRKHGDSIVPKLQEVARSMSSDGGYPYAAAASLIGRGSRRDDDAGGPSEQVASIFRDAFQAYQSAPSHVNDGAYGQFLWQTWRSAPRDLATQAATLITRNLLAAPPDSNTSGEATVADKKVTLQSRSDMTLLLLMPMLKELDPGMLAKVLEARPDFAGAQDGKFRGGAYGPSLQNIPAESRQSVQQARRRGDSMQLARNDPDKALATAATMTDSGDKAVLLAQTAMFMARSSPDDAAKVLDQAQKVAADVKDQMTELRIIISSAQAARQLKQPQRVRELLSRGFDLGAQLLRKQMDEHPETNGQGEALGYMTALVSMSMPDDPDSVIAIIDAVPYPTAKAMLYTAAARSMTYTRRRGEMASTGAAGAYVF